MTARKSISTTKRKAFFEAQGRKCSLCSGIIKPPHEKWDIEHTIPLAMGGADEPGNWTVVHRKCHVAKTAKDLANLAKAKAREAIHLGAKAPPKAKIAARPKLPKPRAEKIPLPPRRGIYTESKQ